MMGSTIRRISFLGALALATLPGQKPAAPAAGDFVVTDAPLRKGWGRCAGAYFDPRFGPVLVFEDAAGTVRQVSISANGSTTVLSTLTRGGN